MADFNLFWKDKDSDAGIIGTYFNAENMGIVHPSVNSLNEQFIVPAPSNNRGFVLKGGTFIKILQPDGSGGYNHLVFGSDADTVVAYTEQRLDTGVSFTPGRDYYIYLCLQAPAQAGQLPTATLVVSLNSTFPSGYNADNSRKIGGFHTLCLAVGSISGHPLSGMNAAATASSTTRIPPVFSAAAAFSAAAFASPAVPTGPNSLRRQIRVSA